MIVPNEFSESEPIVNDGEAEAPQFELCDPAHLHAFAFWYQMRGHERPPSIEEVLRLPATAAKDFRTLLLWVEQLKKDQGLDADWTRHLAGAKSMATGTDANGGLSAIGDLFRMGLGGGVGS